MLRGEVPAEVDQPAREVFASRAGKVPDLLEDVLDPLLLLLRCLEPSSVAEERRKLGGAVVAPDVGLEVGRPPGEVLAHRTGEILDLVVLDLRVQSYGVFLLTGHIAVCTFVLRLRRVRITHCLNG